MTKKTDNSLSEDIQARLDAWQSTIEHYREEATQAEPTARDQAEAEINQLEALRVDAAQNLRRLNQNSSDDQAGIKRAFETLTDEIDQAMQSIAGRFGLKSTKPFSKRNE